MQQDHVKALEAYSHGAMTAIELRRRLGNVGFGDVLRLLADAQLPLPRASTVGREDRLDLARRWLFPGSAG